MFGQLYVFTIRYVGLGTLSSELSYFPASNPPHNMYAVLGRFPVTLYYEQWNRLLGAADEIKAFLEENKSKLKLKDQA